MPSNGAKGAMKKATEEKDKKSQQTAPNVSFGGVNITQLQNSLSVTQQNLQKLAQAFNQIGNKLAIVEITDKANSESVKLADKDRDLLWRERDSLLERVKSLEKKVKKLKKETKK